MNIDELFSSIAAARRDLLAATSGLTNAQGAFRPSPDVWTVAENVEHLVLAEMSGATKICQAADDARAGRLWTGDNPNAGLSIEEIVARTWKPREAAPPIATPHMGGTLRYWESALAACEPMLAAVRAALEGLDLRTVIFPHFLCGPLDAVQRLEFLRFHIERHRAQIERLRAGLPVSL